MEWTRDDRTPPGVASATSRTPQSPPDAAISLAVAGTPPTARRWAVGTALPPFPLRARGQRREAASAWAWAVQLPRTAGGRPLVARGRTAAAHLARALAFKRAGGRATPPHYSRRPGEAAPRDQ